MYGLCTHAVQSSVIVLVAVELVKETKSRVRILSLRVIIRRGRGLGHALHARLLGVVAVFFGEDIVFLGETIVFL